MKKITSPEGEKALAKYLDRRKMLVRNSGQDYSDCIEFESLDEAIEYSLKRDSKICETFIQIKDTDRFLLIVFK